MIIPGNPPPEMSTSTPTFTASIPTMDALQTLDSILLWEELLISLHFIKADLFPDCHWGNYAKPL